MNFNKVILAGRLTRDPESREVTTKNGPTTVTDYTLAVNDGRKGSKTNFIDCVAWGRTGEFAKKWLAKGRSIIVVGSWESDSFTGKEGGRVKVNRCRVNEHYFTDEKFNANSDQVRDDDFFVTLASQPEAPSAPDDGFIVIPDDAPEDGLPFA